MNILIFLIIVRLMLLGSIYYKWNAIFFDFFIFFWEPSTEKGKKHFYLWIYAIITLCLSVILSHNFLSFRQIADGWTRLVLIGALGSSIKCDHKCFFMINFAFLCVVCLKCSCYAIWLFCLGVFTVEIIGFESSKK